MFANNVQEIYTLLFGWKMYEAIWELLVATGLAFIPFLMAVYNAFSGGVTGTIVGSRAGQAQGELEMSIFAMILVLMLGVIPWSGFGGTSMGSMDYGIETPYCPVSIQANNPLDGDADNTQTQNDAAFNSMTSYTVSPPPLWSLVMLLSSAITNSAIASIDCINNYDFLLARMRSIELTDAVTVERVNEFNSVCYQLALEDFNKSPLSIPADASMLDRPDWAGATPFFNTVDRFYLADEATLNYPDGKYGFVRDPASRNADALKPGTVNPSCAEAWYGDGIPGGTSEPLRQAILDAIPDDEVGDIVDDWKTWGFEVITSTLTDEQKEDILIRMVLEGMKGQKIGVAFNGDNYDIVNSKTTPEIVKDVVNFFSSIIASGAAGLEGIEQTFETSIIRVIAPILVVFAQMMIIIVAPFILVSNGYSFSSFLQLALTYFTLEFTDFVWAVAGYFDQYMLMMYADLQDTSTMMTIGFIPLVSQYTYILLPVVWFTLAGMMGVSVMRGFSQTIQGGGMAKGTANTAMSAAKFAGSKGKAAFQSFSSGAKAGAKSIKG